VRKSRRLPGSDSSAATSPRPFVKWAGGKRQLLPALLRRLPANFRRYHEPFVGGGALFFALRGLGRLPHGARLADINPELVNAYQVVRDRVETLIVVLGTFRNEEDFYYEIRAQQPSQLDPVQRAARLLYLNRTCFNGLFRENRAGHFNVPFGRYRNPQFLRENDLRTASRALRGVTIEQGSFAELEQHVETGDFVYFDPPYAPLSRTASFTSYSRGGFDEAAQRSLGDLVRRLGERGVHVLVSNSSARLIYDIYAGDDLHVEQILASRAINSRADRRGKVPELLIAAGPLVDEIRRPAATPFTLVA
jgi:DNA adenine methylase